MHNVMKTEFIVIISGVLALIAPTLTIIKTLKEFIKESRSEKKPLFFVYEVFLNSFSNKQNHYKLKGRLVSKKDVEFKCMNLELPPVAKWEGDLNCYHCEYGERVENIISLNNEEQSSNKVILERKKEEKESFRIGKFYSYDIEGKIVAENENQGKPVKRNTIYKDLKVSLSGVTKGYKNAEIEELKIIKCPNIREIWLRRYIILSMLVVFVGVSSTWICVNNNWSFFINANIWLKLVFGVFGLLLLLTTGYFGWVNYKCMSQLIVLMKMKKFGVPEKPKTEIISDKLLIPKTIEFMAGTEDIDNIL